MIFLYFWLMLFRGFTEVSNIYETLAHPSRTVESIETIRFYQNILPGRTFNVIIVAVMTFQFILDIVAFTIPFALSAHPALKVAGIILLARSAWKSKSRYWEGQIDEKDYQEPYVVWDTVFALTFSVFIEFLLLQRMIGG